MSLKRFLGKLIVQRIHLVVYIHSSDLLPLEVKQSLKVKQYQQSFIANVDTSEKSRTHWMASYFIADRNGEFFDYYGLPPHRYKIL